MATTAIADISAAFQQLQFSFKQPEASVKALDSLDDILDIRTKRTDSGILAFDLPRRVKDISYSDSNVPTPTTGSPSPALSATEGETIDAEISLDDVPALTKSRLGRKVAVLGVGYVGVCATFFLLTGKCTNHR